MALIPNIIYDPVTSTELILETIVPGMIRKYPNTVTTYRRSADLRDIPKVSGVGMREISFQITTADFLRYERVLDYLRRSKNVCFLFMGEDDFASEFSIKDVQLSEGIDSMQTFTINGICYGVEGQMRLANDTRCTKTGTAYADADALSGVAISLDTQWEFVQFYAPVGEVYLPAGDYILIARAKAIGGLTDDFFLNMYDGVVVENVCSGWDLDVGTDAYHYFMGAGTVELNNYGHDVTIYAQKFKAPANNLLVDMIAYVHTSNKKLAEFTISYPGGTPTPIDVTYNPTADNRMRAATPTTVYATDTYLDIGNNGTTSFRPILMFDLSAIPATATINSAVLSLYWYHPAGATRTSDTVMQLFRPAAAWNSAYVCWTNRISATAWANAGGSWYDAAGVSQGSTPFSSVTFPAATVPDNAFHDWDVTALVQAYVNGAYANTGFMFKASVESGNYIAFYSNDYGTPAMRPKLTINYTEAP